jgi:hypothetical protein
MTYATCKAIAFSLFTMAFLLSASSLILFVDAPSEPESRYTDEIGDRSSDSIEGMQMAGVLPGTEQMMNEELSVNGNPQVLK